MSDRNITLGIIVLGVALMLSILTNQSEVVASIIAIFATAYKIK